MKKLCRNRRVDEYMSQPNIFVVPSAKGKRRGKFPTAIEFADFEKIKPADEVRVCKDDYGGRCRRLSRNLSGDRNPLHMDEKFAARTHFQRRVVHGMLDRELCFNVDWNALPGARRALEPAELSLAGAGVYRRQN